MVAVILRKVGVIGQHQSIHLTILWKGFTRLCQPMTVVHVDIHQHIQLAGVNIVLELPSIIHLSQGVSQFNALIFLQRLVLIVLPHCQNSLAQIRGRFLLIELHGNKHETFTV